MTASPIMVSTLIGLDFDNTLADYDRVLHREALRLGLIEAATPAAKREVRDAIRQRPDGEPEWQKLQALVYGPLMAEAELIAGVTDFLKACRARGTAVHIVSHKSRFYPLDPTRTDFREAALAWMERRGFFAECGLSRERVHFEDTRHEKVARIAALGCASFVDDLEETFAEPGFPAATRRLLFAPRGARAADGVAICRDWRQIHERLLDG